ncbi:hypothetical protein ACJRO7_001778 [Eucalyptus globulus]|uniref:Pentatricopeptide repeat-containing protein n=1 Tax=Eucalyptus globulus TaxID=34317 RepID=A0ABD3LS34_EUCGL
MTVSAANSLIKSFGIVGMVEQLLWVWRKMKENGIESSLYAYNFSSVERVFEVMENGRIQPDSVSYDIMVKGLFNVGESQKVMEKLRDTEMRSGISICLGLYREMEEKGLEIPPHAYSLAMSGLCKEEECMEAYAVYLSVNRNGYKANVAIYTTLIDSYAKCGSIEEAMKLFDRMKIEGYHPDEVTFGAIALAYFEHCQNSGVTVNAIIDSSIIDALALSRKMEAEGCDQTVYTFTILIARLFTEHRDEEALRLWDVMIDKGISPNAASIRDCKISDESAPMGTIPDSAVEDMINQSSGIKEACKLVDGIVDRGREIPGKVRTVVINASRRAGNADLALKLMHSKITVGYDRVGSITKRVKFQSLVDS